MTKFVQFLLVKKKKKNQQSPHCRALLKIFSISIVRNANVPNNFRNYILFSRAIEGENSKLVSEKGQKIF